MVDEKAIGLENKELSLNSFLSNKQGNRLTKFAALIVLQYLFDEKALGLENQEPSLNFFLSNKQVNIDLQNSLHFLQYIFWLMKRL